MKTSTVPSNRLIGWLLLIGVALVFVPYTTLTIIFDYPVILRLDPGLVLTRFHAGGPTLILTWWLFAVGGLPLLVAYVLIGQQLDARHRSVRWATTLGVISGIVQIIGLLRWPFVVPVLATHYVNSTDIATKQAVVVAFEVIHQYGGVVLGEHLGQLLTILYTVVMSAVFARLRQMPHWVSWLGYGASGVYWLAQGDLVATVLPGFPTVKLAGLLGSTAWLLWLVMVGIQFLRMTETPTRANPALSV